MLRTYATRYTIIALIISGAFAVGYTVLELIERDQPFVLSALFSSIGPEFILILAVPLIFTVLAFIAGQQRDRAAAYARDHQALSGILHTVMHAPDPDLDQTLPRVMPQIAAALQAEAAAILLRDHDQWIVRAATPDLPDALLPIVQAQPWPPTAEQQVALSVPLDSSGYRHISLTAIRAEAEPIGWLALLSQQTRSSLPSADDLLTTIADLVGSALARAYQYAALRRRARDLEAIAHMNRTLLAGMELDDLLETLVTSAQVRFGLPFAGVLWVDEAVGEFFMRAKAGPLARLAPPNYQQKLTDGVAAVVYRTGQSYLVRDVQAEPDFINAIDAPVKSSFMAPMIVGDKVIAVMGFDSLGRDAFTPEDVAALTTLADQAAIAAENARLVSKAKHEHRRVMAILHSTADVVILIDNEDRVQVLNPAAERLLGVTAGEAIGLPIDLLFSLKPLLENYRQVDDHTSAALAFETTLGRDTTYLVTVTLARDETGAVFGRVLVLKDISYLKRLDQFKSQMIQMASHDLRTPLGVASGYVELLREELPPSPEYDTLLNGLEGALDRMQTLVVELLDLERVEAGIDQIQASVDVGQLVVEAVANFADEARGKQQTLELTVQESLPAVVGDPLRLKQALSNLINNAVKYTPEGGHIEVKVFHDDQQVTVEVQDTGYGIPQELQSKVFQRFFRAKVPGTENIAGTGLGLSLVKAVIEQHAGSITLESEEGQGSTFRVQLPIADSDQEISHGQN